MGVRFAVVLVAVLPLGCASEAKPYPVWGAPNPGDVPPGDMSFDCDAPADYRSEWSQKIDSSGHVRGALIISSVRKSDQAPSANAAIHSADGSMTTLHVDYRRGAGKLVPSVRAFDSHHAGRTVTLQDRSSRGIAFELAWKPNVVRIRLDSDAPWLDVPIASPPDRLILGCSTGNTVFYSVTVDPPSPAPSSPTAPAPSPSLAPAPSPTPAPTP